MGGNKSPGRYTALYLGVTRSKKRKKGTFFEVLRTCRRSSSETRPKFPAQNSFNCQYRFKRDKNLQYLGRPGLYKVLIDVGYRSICREEHSGYIPQVHCASCCRRNWLCIGAVYLGPFCAVCRVKHADAPLLPCHYGVCTMHLIENS